MKHVLMVFRTEEQIQKLAEFYSKHNAKRIVATLSAVNRIVIDTTSLYVLIARHREDVLTGELLLPKMWHENASNIYTYDSGTLHKEKETITILGSALLEVFHHLKKYDGALGIVHDEEFEEFDIHRLTAARMFGIDYSEVTDEQRRHAKSVNYSEQFVQKMRDEDIRIDTSMIQDFMDNHHKKMADPELRIKEIQPHSRIISYFGHEFYVPHKCEWLAINGDGKTYAFEYEPTFDPAHTDAEDDFDTWLPTAGEIPHPVVVFELGEIESENTLRKYPLMKWNSTVRGTGSMQMPRSVMQIPKDGA